jgi:hypothetical protein
MSTKNKGVKISDQRVSDAQAMATVIELQAKLEARKQEVAALKKDRAELLREHQDLRKASYPSKFKVQPARQRQKADIVRVCAGDFHGMRMDRAAVEAFLADLKRWDPDEIVLGGDLIDCSGWLAKHHPIGFVAETDYTYQEDIICGNWILDEVIKAAPSARIIYLQGNHEERVERNIIDLVASNRRDADFLMSLASPQKLLNLEERGVEFFHSRENYVPGAPLGWIKLGKIFFTHSVSTSKNAARDSAARTDGNLVYFHTHRRDESTLKSPGVGVFAASNPGCMCKFQPIYSASRPDEWAHGYQVQFVAKSGLFQSVNVLINEGQSLVGPLQERILNQ